MLALLMEYNRVLQTILIGFDCRKSVGDLFFCMFFVPYYPLRLSYSSALSAFRNGLELGCFLSVRIQSEGSNPSTTPFKLRASVPKPDQVHDGCASCLAFLSVPSTLAFEADRHIHTPAYEHIRLPPVVGNQVFARLYPGHRGAIDLAS